MYQIKLECIGETIDELEFILPFIPMKGQVIQVEKFLIKFQDAIWKGNVAGEGVFFCKAVVTLTE